MFRSNKPVVEGQELILLIDDISKQGDAVAHIERFVVFIKDARAYDLHVGQNVKARITRVLDRYSFAEVAT